MNSHFNVLLTAKPWSLFSWFSSSKFPFESQKSFGGTSYHSKQIVLRSSTSRNG